MWLPKTCLECWFTYLWYALVHVAAEDVLGVLVHILVVRGIAKDGSPAAGAAADAHACEQLQGRDDGHREAPAADGLPSQPRAEEAREGGVHQRDDAADTGQALDAREASAADSCLCPRRLGTRSVALSRLRSGG